jgi:hypothetical protein
MLIVVAIIVILTTMVIGIAARMDEQSKEQLTRNTIAIVTAALREFHDYGYRYKYVAYFEFDFPLDVIEPASGPPPTGVLITTLIQEFGVPVLIEPVNPGEPINHKEEYTSSELLYFFLSRVSGCRKTLDKIHRTDKDRNIVKSMITDKDDDGYRMKIKIGNEYFPLLRIVDPWGTTLLYDYSYEHQLPSGSTIIVKRTFPEITSAGPDKTFGTADDISSR